LTLKAVATVLLVPPISLLLAAIIGLLIDRRSRRIGRFLTWAGLAGLLVLAMPAAGGSLMIALERDLPLTPPPDLPPQAIVILGGDVVRGGTRTETLNLGTVSLERLQAGAQLWRRTGLPILVSGGSLREGDAPVAALMADSLVHDFQVPVRWIEAESLDTWDNAHNSATILHEHGIQSVYVVTQAWHMRRAIMAFAETGVTITAAPPRLDRLLKPLAANFVPDAGAWRDSYYALHEWIGGIYYAVRRGAGRTASIHFDQRGPDHSGL
jgi:uncharacterized SAM-binding protein YcdF (DUF218 family)